MGGLLNAISENSNVVAYLSLFISACAFFLNRYNYVRFARNEFIKKQIQDVIDLTTYLNSEIFEVGFTLFSSNGSTSSNYKTNIFELKNLEFEEISQHFADSPIHFSRGSNQILDLKKYINNPFIPISIANELTKFYSFNIFDLTSEQIEGEQIIVIHSKVFEESDFQRLAEPSARLRQPSAFAFESFENLIICAALLQKSIVKWLEKYRVDQINIRSYFWRED